MRDEIPTLSADERALLQRFRVDESPEPAVAARVLRSLSAQLGASAPTVERPWWLWLRAGGLSVAIAACGLLVLGGTARVLAPTPRPSATEAMDVATPTATPKATEPAAVPAAPVAAITPEAPLPEVRPSEPAAAPPVLEASKPKTRASRPNVGEAPAPAPIDAAAEIALFGAIKTERDAGERLAAITRYRRDFAKGSFTQEVAVLEIEALCKLGRTREATERSAAFADRFGDSAYAAIARRGCAEAKP
jgi:hypothetical protein